MLKERIEFIDWFESSGLSPHALPAIENIRSSQPSRRVQGRAGNVTGRYPSRKMGHTIQFESHRNELAFILELEYDDDCLEFFDQPPSIKLHYHTKANKHIGIIHTPDFFVIRNAVCLRQEGVQK